MAFNRIILTGVLVAAGLLWACSDDGNQPADAGGDTSDDGGTSDLGPATYDGAWAPGFDATAEGAFLSVWGSSASDIVAVGGQPGSGTAYRFDAGGWQPLEIPDGDMLFWVFGVDDQLFMVGEGGRALISDAEGTIAESDTGTDVDLWGVWGSRADAIWAVGGNVRTDETGPVLLRYDGSEWTDVALPEMDRSPAALFKVWGTSQDNVIAVGSVGVILRYDGDVWAQEASGTGEDLISLWGRSPNDIAVAGGRSNGVLARYDGTSWEVDVLLGLPGLNGVWMDAEGTAHMVGVRGASARVAAGGFEYEREITDTVLTLHGVWGVHDGVRVAVGGSLATSPPYDGVVLVDP